MRRAKGDNTRTLSRAGGGWGEVYLSFLFLFSLSLFYFGGWGVEDTASRDSHDQTNTGDELVGEECIIISRESFRRGLRMVSRFSIGKRLLRARIGSLMLCRSHL